MHICLFEDEHILDLKPLVHTRCVYQVRIGAKSFLERVRLYFPQATWWLHARKRLEQIVHLQTNLPVNQVPANEGVLFLNGRLIMCEPMLVERLSRAVSSNEDSRLFWQNEHLVAVWVRSGASQVIDNHLISPPSFPFALEEQVEGAVFYDRLWHVLDQLHATLLVDLEEMLRTGFSSGQIEGSISPHARLLNSSEIRVASTARIRAGAILDAHNGPIVLDEGAEVMEQSIVRGPLYIGKGSTIKARSEIEGSSIGPVCKVAGEVMDVVFQSYSNKAHQGFLGHSYLGSWCNLGAGTISSNLRNDYGKVTLYNEHRDCFEETHRQFLGLFMADHSKLGINSMCNTGSVIGVSCNIYGGDFVPRHVPSFSWGSPETGFEPYRIRKALEVARRVMGRRRLELSDDEATLLTQIYNEIHAGALPL